MATHDVGLVKDMHARTLRLEHGKLVKDTKHQGHEKSKDHKEDKDESSKEEHHAHRAHKEDAHGEKD